MKTKITLVAGILFLQTSLLSAAPLNLTIEDSIDYALHHSVAIELANKDKDQALLTITSAQNEKLPTVSLGSATTYQNGDHSDTNTTNSLHMNLALYTGGQTEAKIDQAKLNAIGSEISIEKTKQQVVLDSTSAYYDALKAMDMVKVNQETVDNLKAHLDIVNAKFEIGLVAKADVLRSQVELANAEQNLIKADNNKEVAVLKLLKTINMNLTTEVDLTKEAFYEPEARDLSDLIRLAKENRPELAKANIDEKVALKNIEVAEAGKRPTVSLSAGSSWQDNALPDNNWTVGVSANWNVFDGNLTKTQIKTAKVALEKANLAIDDYLMSIEQEVRENFLGVKEAEKRLETTMVTVRQAEEDLFIAQEKYNAGVGTNLDLFDAQLALTQAKTNHIQALYDSYVAKAKLNKAIGLKV